MSKRNFVTFLANIKCGIRSKKKNSANPATTTTRTKKKLNYMELWAVVK